ncbi:D-alanyl-D-alanine carboxypeptidase family protein [Haloferula sargassicola]|uniref:D-alanyl-D-alanine carboxypeptidase DacB n=1 Tax=Haloferula sargassicola TaxID=490096 RepID=A0ABP9US95_9BACT
MNRVISCICALLALAMPALADEAVMVVEAHSGKVLIGRHTTVKRPVASLTKIATGVLVVDWAEAAGVDLATTRVTVPPAVAGLGGANPMQLAPGESLSALDALFSAMLGSDNAAALTLADHVGREFLRRHGRSGDPVGAFVQEMNHLAEALNMRKTRFVNPHGLEAPNSVGLSTAADIAKLSIYAMRRPGMSFVTRQPSRQVKVSGAAGERIFNIKNTNQLVSEHVIGLKTGTTAAAGECLAVAVERDPLIRPKADGSKGVTPRRLIVVLLDSPNRFARAKGLIDQGWGIYDSWVNSGATVQDRDREILTVPDPRG